MRARWLSLLQEFIAAAIGLADVKLLNVNCYPLTGCFDKLSNRLRDRTFDCFDKLSNRFRDRFQPCSHPCVGGHEPAAAGTQRLAVTLRPAQGRPVGRYLGRKLFLAALNLLHETSQITIGHVLDL